MNNFTGDAKHMELISTTFQNMFPSININKVKLKEIRRVLLLHYNEEDDTIDLRHYTITVSLYLEKILGSKGVGILSKFACNLVVPPYWGFQGFEETFSKQSRKIAQSWPL